jgi:epoxyqueuosine reductase
MRTINYHQLASQIKQWGRQLGFQQIGITDIDLSSDAGHLQAWLQQGRHGEMRYMSRHGARRSRPAELVPGTIRVISARMDYYPPASRPAGSVLADRQLAYISRYALGRDYHRLLRRRLQQLAERIEGAAGAFGYRAFVDSAPVMEKALARNAGLGWIGKHSNLINPRAGSWFFLGELYTDLPLPPDRPFHTSHCGSCSACLEICPTQAIVAPFEVDARRCISYLTIELHGPIPEQFRIPMGNRIFGCDDCQLVCPWNRFARSADEPGFRARHGLDAARLAELFLWSGDEFARRTEGSAIRRIGYDRWLRNIAVALGNAAGSEPVIAALTARLRHGSELVREHVQWALRRHEIKGVSVD